MLGATSYSDSPSRYRDRQKPDTQITKLAYSPACDRIYSAAWCRRTSWGTATSTHCTGSSTTAACRLLPSPSSLSSRLVETPSSPRTTVAMLSPERRTPSSERRVPKATACQVGGRTFCCHLEGGGILFASQQSSSTQTFSVCVLIHPELAQQLFRPPFANLGGLHLAISC